MRFLNLTRRNEIGANCYALDLGGKRIVLDSGLHPTQEGLDALPDFGSLPDGSVDAILLSHAHQDHIGSLPVLARRQPNARIFASEPTRQITDVMLHNSVNVMLRLREDRAISCYPLFTHREADMTVRRLQPTPLGQRWNFEGERLGANEEAEPGFEFFDAGHLLGSTGMLLRGEGRSVFYTGDVNFEDQTLSRAASFPEGPLDVAIIETTRGDSPRPDGETRATEEQRLADALAAAFESGGTILIPVFALGKTQELLALLHRFQEQRLIPRGFPLYIGGLSSKLTEIYDRHAGHWPRLQPELQLFDSLSPFVVGGREIDDLPLKRGRIYALTSGMMTEKTLSYVLGERMLANPVHHLFFIGYADPNSPGGHIRAASRGDLVQLTPGATALPLECEVQSFNLSAHATRESIRAWVNRTAPKKIVLVHGDPAAMEWFRQTLSADLPGSEILIPPPGETIEI